MRNDDHFTQMYLLSSHDRANTTCVSGVRFHAGSRIDMVIASLTFMLSIFIINYPAQVSLFSINLKGNHEVVVTILIENRQTMDKD